MSRSGRMSNSHLPALLGDNLPSPGHSSGGMAGGVAPGGSGSGGGGLSMFPQYASHRGGASRSAQLASSWSAPGSRDASVPSNTAGLVGASPASESYLASPRDTVSKSPRVTTEPSAHDSNSGPSHPATVHAPGSYPGRQPSHRFPTAQTLTTLGEDDASSRKSHVQSSSLLTVAHSGSDRSSTHLQPLTSTTLTASVSEEEQPASTERVHPRLRSSSSAASAVAAVLSALNPAATAAAPWLSQPKAVPAHGDDSTELAALAYAREQHDSSASARAFEKSPSIRLDEGAGRVPKYPPVLSPFQTLSSQCLMPGGEDGEEDTHSTVAVRVMETCRSNPM